MLQLNYLQLDDTFSLFRTGDGSLSHFTFTTISQLITNILTIYLMHQLDYFKLQIKLFLQHFLHLRKIPNLLKLDVSNKQKGQNKKIVILLLLLCPFT